MEKNRWIKEVLLKAGNELKAADKEMGSLDPVADVVCFLCQRACVMVLVAWLVSRDPDCQPLRQLEWLLESCKRRDPDFIAVQSVTSLQAYSSETVSMDEHDFPRTPTREEAQNALEVAEYVRHFVLKKI